MLTPGPRLNLASWLLLQAFFNRFLQKVRHSKEKWEGIREEYDQKQKTKQNEKPQDVSRKVAGRRYLHWDEEEEEIRHEERKKERRFDWMSENKKKVSKEKIVVVDWSGEIQCTSHTPEPCPTPSWAWSVGNSSDNTSARWSLFLGANFRHFVIVSYSQCARRWWIHWSRYKSLVWLCSIHNVFHFTARNKL